MAGKINGVALGSIAVGSLLLYAGITGKNIPQAVQAVISGKSPATAAKTAAIISTDPSAYPNNPGNQAPISGTRQAQIAAIAQSYVGKLTYVYGGPPPPGTVDCSSFASKVLAEAGIARPGGAAFDPAHHGPTTLQYLFYGTAVSRSAVQAGDLCVYQTHMGIAISNTEMVSAQTPNSGVQKSTIDGVTKSLGEILFCRAVPSG